MLQSKCGKATPFENGYGEKKMQDKELQHQILKDLASFEPRGTQLALADFEYYQAIDNEKLIDNLLYLEQDGLIQSGLVQSADGLYSHSASRITRKGLEYLQSHS